MMVACCSTRTCRAAVLQAIVRVSVEDVAYRVMVADQVPDQATAARFASAILGGDRSTAPVAPR
jgi:hypothetical protein